MPHKTFSQAAISISILVALLIVPVSALAGGVCGGTYIVEQGDTLEQIAAMCGITVSAIQAANPGIGTSLHAGQTLTLPGGSSVPSSTPIPPTQPPTVVNNYYTTNNYYTYYNPYSEYLPTQPGGTYVVQYGDTFAGIAARFGLTVNQLLNANPFIWNINFIYAGQTLNIPAPGTYPSMPSVTKAPEFLAYGTVPRGADQGTVKLVNQANGDVYISFQGTTGGGYNVIREYSVDGTMKVNIPAAWYDYVAWVGGIQFTGGFHLGGGSDHVITFYSNKVVVQ